MAMYLNVQLKENCLLQILTRNILKKEQNNYLTINNILN